MAGSLCAEPVVSEPITAQALLVKQKATSLSTLPQPGVDAPEVPRAGNQSVIARSEILHDGQHWTLIPKGAVLFVPANRIQNVGARPAGNFLQWNDFLARNPAWISTHETTFGQASGDDPIPAEKTDFWKTQDRVIVAVHQGGPISVAR